MKKPAPKSASVKQVVRGGDETSKQSIKGVGASQPTPPIKKSASKFTTTKKLPK